MITSLVRIVRAALTWSLGLVPLALFLIVWQAWADDSSAFFPPPSTWFDQIAFSGPGGLFALLRSTITVFALGVFAAFVVGFVAGLGLGRSRLFDSSFSPTIEFLRAIPAPTIVPLVILFAGPGRPTLVASVLLAAVWPILLNSMESARAIDTVLVDSSRTLKLSALQRVRKVLAPAVLPGALIGVRVALPIALVVTLLAEMLTGSAGIGGALMQAQRSYQTANAYGLLVVAGAVGVLLAAVFGVIQRLALRAWKG